MEKLFDYFWKKYPKKVGKKQCKEHWKKLKPSPELYTIMMVALDKQKKYKDICNANNVFVLNFLTLLDGLSTKDGKMKFQI